MRNIRQNLFFAFIYNTAGVPIAAGVSVSVLWDTVIANDRSRGHELQFGFRDQQFAQTKADAVIEREKVLFGSQSAASVNE
jgi:hypothetical protein